MGFDDFMGIDTYPFAIRQSLRLADVGCLIKKLSFFIL